MKLLQPMVVFRYIIFLGIVIAAKDTTAQNQSYLPLGKAVNLAIAHYPSIQSKQAIVDASKASLKETENAWLPNLKLSDQFDAGTNNSLNGSYFPMGIVPSSSGGRRLENNASMASGNVATIYGDWEIYNFGGYRARNEEARAALKVSENGLGTEQYFVQSAVISNYLELIKYESLVRIQLNNIERTQTILDAISAFVNSGLRSGVDSSVAAAELSKARLTYIDLVNNVNLLKIQLATFTGLDSSAIKADTNIISNVFSVLATYSFADSSYNQHPLLQFYHSIYEDNMAQETVIRKSYLPKVSLMASSWIRSSSISPADEYKETFSTFGYTRYNYLAGLAITYNLFDIKRTQLKLNIQRSRSQAARQNFEEQKLQLSNSLAQANTNLRATLKKLSEIPVQKKAASDAYLQKKALYNAGLANIVDVTNALYLLNRAETDEVLVRNEAWKAIFQQANAGNQVNQLLTIFK